MEVAASRVPAHAARIGRMIRSPVSGREILPGCSGASVQVPHRYAALHRPVHTARLQDKVLKREVSMRIKIAVAALAGMAVAATASAQERSWRHAMVTAKSDAGIVMMVTKGFAAKQGLKLDVTQVQSDTIELKALLAGELDSFEGGPGGSMIAASRGADVKILGCQWPGLPHGIFVRGDIKSVKDLKGKTVAISQPGAMPDELVRALLAKDNVLGRRREIRQSRRRQ